MTATATSVVTTGANSAVRKNGLNQATREFSSSAAPSEAPIDNGTPTATKYRVLPSACQNSGVRRRRK
jgi:hypothetical protein